jgi:hypothetical protein
MSDTPETDAFIEALNDDWDYEFAALTSHAKKLERERDALRELSIQLAKELVSKCSDPVHRHQVSQLQEAADFFKYRPQTVCTSSP